MGATGIVKRWPDKPMYWSTVGVITTTFYNSTGTNA